MALDIKKPILVFDSGVGGISVLKQLTLIMPEEDFIFFGDSKNAPYGTKAPEEVLELTLGHIKHYVEMGIKGACIACNTATSTSINELRRLYPDLPLVGIEPAIKPAAEKYPGGRILVMATPITIAGKKLHENIEKYSEDAEIIPLACPGLMEFIEAGKIDSPELITFLDKLLKPYIDDPVDAFVTGCTHYPFITDKIFDVLGGKAEPFDGAPGTARELKRRLNNSSLLRHDGNKGHIFFEDSDPSPEKLNLCRELYKRPVFNVR